MVVGFDDLKKIQHLIYTQNLHTSAEALNISVSALSKQVKKIENKLGTPLFDRVGRNIIVNEQGKKFSVYARSLVHEYEQMCSEFSGTTQHLIRIAAPALLISAFSDRVTSELDITTQSLKFLTAFEGDAIKMLASGQVDMAIVTHEAQSDWQMLNMQCFTLDTLLSHLYVANNHPLANKNQAVSSVDIAQYPFICPTRSPFCGIERGLGSDGWPDHLLPRKIGVFTDDLQSQLQLMKTSDYMSYLPDVVGEGAQLVRLKLDESVHRHETKEKISLVYQPSVASGWLNQFIAKIT